MAVASEKAFGPFRFDSGTGELWKGGVRIRLQDQPARVLMTLVERPGELVSRDELRQRLWPDDTFVDFDHALTTAVKKLRRALNDSPQRPRYVETLPKRGYRFVADVENFRPPAEPQRAATVAVEPKSSALFQRNIALVLLAGALTALVWTALRESPEPAAPTRRFSFAADAPAAIFARRIAIAPDGHAIAYISSNAIWIRELDQIVPRRLAGTTGATGLFWSPDSRTVAFANESELRKVSAQGGPTFLVCALPGLSFSGGAWSPDGQEMVIAADIPATLFRVASDGGTPRQPFERVMVGSSGGNRDPWFVNAPGERKAIVFAAGDPTDFRLFARALDGGEAIELAPGRLPALSAARHILFQPSAEGGIWALPFSTDSLAAQGPPFLVESSGIGPTVADDGTLVFGEPPTGSATRLVSRDREGNLLGVIAEGEEVMTAPAVSPDGGRVAFQRIQARNRDVWIREVESGLETRVSVDPAVDGQPVWSPSGQALAWRSDARGSADLVWRPIGQSAGTMPLVSTEGSDRPGGWAPDGQDFVFSTSNRETGIDIWLAQSSGVEGTFHVKPLLDSEFQEVNPRVSPDGGLLAYCSNETGQYEVYVREFPSGERARQVSRAGGCQPRWARDGRELLYVEGETLMSVAVTLEPVRSVATPEPLFRDPNLASPGPMATTYDVWPGGERIAMTEAVAASPGQSPPPSQIHIVENWFSQFKN